MEKEKVTEGEQEVDQLNPNLARLGRGRGRGLRKQGVGEDPVPSFPTPPSVLDGIIGVQPQVCFGRGRGLGKPRVEKQSVESSPSPAPESVLGSIDAKPSLFLGRGRGIGVKVEEPRGPSLAAMAVGRVVAQPKPVLVLGRGRSAGVQEEGEKYEPRGRSPAQKAFARVDAQPKLVLGRGRGRSSVEAVPIAVPEDVHPGVAEHKRKVDFSNIMCAIIDKPAPPAVSTSVSTPSPPILEEVASNSFGNHPKEGCDTAGAEEADDLTLTPEEAMTLLKLNNFGSFGSGANNTVPETTMEGAAARTETFGPPSSHYKLADEFRMDAALSPEPLISLMLCNICGAPAGSDAYSCNTFGHLTCSECKVDFNPQWCHFKFMNFEMGTFHFCKGFLEDNPTSRFRTFLFANTKYNCMNSKKGCKYVDIWENVKIHQTYCEFGTPPAIKEGLEDWS